MKLFVPFLLMSFTAQAQIPISEVRTFRAGKIVTVHGQVTATFGDLAFIQDHTGGIGVYGTTLMINDSISVTGKLAKFNGMLEIVADSVNVISAGQPRKPKVIRIIEMQDHEGELVQLNNILLTPAALFFYPQRSGLLISPTDTSRYWIDENTDIAGYSIPATSTDMRGIVGRFGDQLQLLPRSHADIEAVTIDHPAPANNFRVMNWNVEFFGASGYGPSNDSLQMENVAAILNEVQADVVALQEISSDDAFRVLLHRLPGYQGRCSSRYSYSFDTGEDFPPQKLCFVYKTNEVKLVREEILFREMFDNNPSDMFSSGRLPYLIKVETAGGCMNIINIHGKSGDSPADLERRRTDANLLKSLIEAEYADDFILLGDFNDDVDESIVEGYASPYSGFDNCISRSLSDAGWHSTISYDDMIDHQVVSSTLKDYVVSTSIVNVFSMVPRYARTTSDHLPVISEFNFTIAGLTNEALPVFPNPTRDDLWFPANSDITVINSLGEIIIKKQGAHPPISLGEYAPGLYSVVLGNQLIRIIRN